MSHLEGSLECWPSLASSTASNCSSGPFSGWFLPVTWPPLYRRKKTIASSWSSYYSHRYGSRCQLDLPTWIFYSHFISHSHFKLCHSPFQKKNSYHQPSELPSLVHSITDIFFLPSLIPTSSVHPMFILPAHSDDSTPTNLLNPNRLPSEAPSHVAAGSGFSSSCRGHFPLGY